MSTKTNNAVVPAADPREAVLMRALGLDRATPEQRELTIAIAERYDLDPMLRHILLVDGRPYVTRDGLLHVAHRSGQFDGIEATDAIKGDTHWSASCTVYRKDMSHGITYTGRYPVNGSNARFAPEMAVKVAEVQALRRAFDVAASTIEERWDIDTGEAQPVVARPVASLAEKVAARSAAIVARPEASVAHVTEPADAPISGGTSSAVPTPATEQDDVAGPDVPPDQATGEVEPAGANSLTPSPVKPCGSPSPYDDGGTCTRDAGHQQSVMCTDEKATWPRPKDWV